MQDLPDLSGTRILLVEDEPLVAMLVREMVEELGCIVVAEAACLADAEAAVGAHAFDVALLDVNLGREPVYPLAATLTAAGRPFVFASGQGGGGLPAEFVGAPVVDKPCTQADLAHALAAAVRAGTPTTVG